MEWIAARWVTFFATMLVTGACTVGLLLLPRTPDDRGTRDALARDAARAGVLACLLCIPASMLRLADQIMALRLPGDPVLTNAGALLGSTTWGTGFLWQAAALLLALGALRAASRSPRATVAWTLAVVGAIGLCVTPALQGHAIGSEQYTIIAVAADIAHVTGAGLWLGTLGMIAVLGVTLPNSDGITSPERARLADARLSMLVPLVPRVALPGAALLLVSGVTSAVLHLREPSDLWRVEWGRYVLIKTVLAIAIVALGAVNWRRLGPRLPEADGVPPLRRSLLIELGVSALLLLVTATLVVTPLPGE